MPALTVKCVGFEYFSPKDGQPSPWAFAFIVRQYDTGAFQFQQTDLDLMSALTINPALPGTENDTVQVNAVIEIIYHTDKAVMENFSGVWDPNSINYGGFSGLNPILPLMFNWWNARDNTYSDPSIIVGRRFTLDYGATPSFTITE